MDVFVLFGVLLGALAGVAHAIHLYRRRRADGAAGVFEAAWFALWALGLWTLFGVYVLAMWLIGAAGLGVARMRAPSSS